MSTTTRVSVVISTYNRASGLRSVLEGLRRQTHDDFEAIVVNGPSTDGTAAVLAEYADRVRIGDCAEQSLTRSRNIGISMASGEVVAFIDDDALPEPTWLADLLSGYDGESIGGVGGIVYDHTGFRLQYKYSICSRVGEPRWDVEPPLEGYLVPGSDPFLYLQGTNQSYLRRHLAQVGGFNERLEHYYDDSEISMQLIDAGHRLRALPVAAVHHKYMASSVRNHERVLIDPYRVIKDRFRFALTACRERSSRAVTDALLRWAESMREGGRGQRDAGQLTDEQFDRYSRRIDEAVDVALRVAPTLERPRRQIPAADDAEFRRYPTVRAEGHRLTVCFLSKEYPPGDFGGVGRLTADFADGFAARGHEVHVVTESRDVSRVDFEEGVWVHRLEFGEPPIEELADVPVGPNLSLVASMYREVCRIHERGPVDLVVAALWLAEGIVCSLDPRFATVLLLESGTRTIADFHPSWEASSNIQQLIALEGALFRRARHLHAISHDILRTVQGQYGRTSADAFVIPLGRRDHRGQFRRKRGPDGRLRVLFVSRLERRKGVDVLLPVAARLIRSYPHVEFVLAGKDTDNTELGETYTSAFRREFGQDREVRSRVTFTGWLSDDALMQAYADADVFCLPARYESLGLVAIEAMAFGLPVVVSGVGGLLEIVEPERSGLLVPVEDEAALEAALRRLIEDPALRERLGERSRRLFEEKFDLSVTVPRTIEALQRVAADQGAAPEHQRVDRDEARREVGRRLPR
jgi:glycosyltransferase involved in cell wall biosynthesis